MSGVNMQASPLGGLAGALTILLVLVPPLEGQRKPRARDLGIPFPGTPGTLNAVTDVAGVTVGHATIISGDGALKIGGGPVRTGVTVVLPRGAETTTANSFAGWFSLNGNGEMTGTTWLDESGVLEGPIAITNTHSVGVVRDALIAWRVRQPGTTPAIWWGLPVVAETYDGFLNDINGFHVKESHVVAALESARSEPVAEGSVGGGTGMVCFGFKCGIGTSSRRVEIGGRPYVVGVLVQANFGRRPQLLIAGVPVGQEITDGVPYALDRGWLERGELGSIIVVVATDAPMLPHQLKRIARRASHGVARTGGTSGNGSGDIFIAFSTANPVSSRDRGISNAATLANGDISPLFDATVYATEEAIVNALVAGETMIGIDGHRVIGLPHDRLREVLRKFNRADALPSRSPRP
jgi:D-aminopeptidase